MRIKFAGLLATAMLVAAGVGAQARAGLTSSGDTRPAFTLKSRVTRIDSNDGSQSSSQEVRYVSADGNFRVVKTEANGEVSEYFFERGRGHFTVNHATKRLIPNKNVPPAGRPAPPLTAEQLLSHPQFLKTEELLGYTVYVLRVTDEATGLPSADVYHAAELGSTPLKLIIYANGKASYVTEAVSIDWGEPDPALLRAADYPAAD